MEMIMTSELADNLMEDLVCVAVSAMGGVIVNEDGSFDLEQMDMAEEYAKKAFTEILGVWEKFTGTKWKIIVGGLMSPFYLPISAACGRVPQADFN